jgi:hypothetical protein
LYDALNESPTKRPHPEWDFRRSVLLKGDILMSSGPPNLPPNYPPNFPPNPPPSFPNAQAPLPPAKKSNVLVWILGGVVVVALGFTAMCGIGGYLLMHKAKQAGFDSSLMSKNPGYAAAKMVATLNKDVDVISSDDSTGTIQVRDKKTGQTTTLRFDAATRRMVVTDGEGKQSTVSITGDGDKTALNIQSADGTAKFSAGDSQMPAWVPVYPGSTPKGTYSAQNNGGSQSAFGFMTTDPPAKVIAYYQDQLKSSGFTITGNFTSPAGGLVTGENGKRTLTITVNASGSETSASLIAVEKE